MFSDVAKLWENEGHEKIKKMLDSLINQKTSQIMLPNTEESKEILHSAMQCFSHAAEYYLQVSSSLLLTLAIQPWLKQFFFKSFHSS